MLDVKVDGIETIDSDYGAFNGKVRKATTYGLRAFASELTPTLQKHIEMDVYAQYTPKRYKRRYNNPEYGTSIHDSDNMTWNMKSFNGRQGVEFTYAPDGENKHYPNSPYYKDGDSLIHTIQEDKGYLWKESGRIGKERPFWNRFVGEVKQQGDGWFVHGFNSSPEHLGATQYGAIEIDGSDYRLYPSYAHTDYDEPTDGKEDNDGELPF